MVDHGHGSKYARKKEEAVAALLTQPTIEEAARAAGIGTQTLIRWMKVPDFQVAYREARHAAVSQSNAQLQQFCSAAAMTLFKIMMDPKAPASARLRAADHILDHANQALESEDNKVRFAALEQAARQALESEEKARSEDRERSMLYWMAKFPDLMDDVPGKPEHCATSPSNENYKAWICEMPCTRCGVEGRSEAVHTGADVGKKESDYSCIPLCSNCHTDGQGAYHLVGEAIFERRFGVCCAQIVARLNREWKERQAA